MSKSNYSIVTFVLSVLILIILFSACKKKLQNNCDGGILYNQTMRFDSYDVEELDQAKVYAVLKTSKKNIDSTVIQVVGKDPVENANLRKPYYYLLSKPLCTNYDWIIVLKNKKQIHISEIKVEQEDNWTMFGSKKRCTITKWKINGVDHSANPSDTIDGFIE